MKLSKHRRLPNGSRPPLPPRIVAAPGAAGEPPSVPALVARIFTRLHLAQRVGVLRRLLLPVGPLALAVVGGGVFAKYALQARWARLSVSLDDAAQVTSAQVYELVRYVEQANPALLQDVVASLARDTTVVATLGASVAAIVVQQLAHSGRGDG